MMVTYKPTLANVKRAAAAVGATVEDDSAGGFVTYQVIAPKGKVWACDGSIHMLKVCVNEGRERPAKEERISAFQDVLNRISHGVVACEEPECEFCCEDV